MAKRQIVTGRIIAVQEGRLRLCTASGQGLLLTLGRFVHLPAGLDHLLRVQALLRVVYEGESNLASGVVKRIELI